MVYLPRRGLTFIFDGPMALRFPPPFGQHSDIFVSLSRRSKVMTQKRQAVGVRDRSGRGRVVAAVALARALDGDGEVAVEVFRRRFFPTPIPTRGVP